MASVPEPGLSALGDSPFSFVLPAKRFPNCESPVDFRVQTGEERVRTLAGRCGSCWSCLGAKAHRKAGKILAEVAAPWHEAHEAEGVIQFSTLTYPDEALPLSVPAPHDLRLNWAGTGPYVGPFAKPARGRRPFVWEGVAYWWPVGNSMPRALTERELAVEHERYLREVLGWTSEQVGEWREGRYEPAPTLRRAHSIAMLKRMRRWVSEHRPDWPMFRFAFTGEYGDLYGRPHYHAIIFGWPNDARAIEYFYSSWREHHAKAIVWPDRMDALHQGALTLGPGTAGAQYVCKDLSKMRRDLRASPSLASRELPFQALSKYPPLGVRKMEEWLLQVVKPAAEQAEQAGEDEVGVCVAVRRAFIRAPVRYGGVDHQFSSPPHWRESVRKLFDEEIWRLATWELREELAVLQGDGESWRAEVLNEHKQACREKNRGNEARAARRKRKQALRRLPTAALGPGGPVLL